jgi:anti-sigma factor RsiW
MKDEMRPLLGAYHDGELDEAQMRRVAQHLLGCPECRRELAALAELGALLGSGSPAPTGAAPERFVSQVMLRLPRHQPQPAWRLLLHAAWWSVPAVILLGWAVLQAVLITSGLIVAAIGAGLGGTQLASVFPGNALGGWVAGLLAAVPGSGGIERVLGPAAAPLAIVALASLVLVAVGALVYWSWLASWQVRTNRLPQ